MDHPIDYRNEDFAEVVMRLTDGEGVDVAFDAIGPSSFRKDYKILRPGGASDLLRAQRGPDRREAEPARLLKGVATMTTATMPWWKSLMMLNENKGVFGLNMLWWWEREGPRAA